jgi:hypothetical protein
MTCFQDHDSRVRYYACESLYNVAKVARGSILYWFNEIFDALTKVSFINIQLSVDVELSVKNGAELLDRLIKDIVSEKVAYSCDFKISDPVNSDELEVIYILRRDTCSKTLQY